MSEKVYSWDNCPNISLLDKKVAWWNEQEIAIRAKKRAGEEK